MPRLARFLRTSAPMAARNAATDAVLLGEADFSRGLAVDLATAARRQCNIVHALYCILSRFGKRSPGLIRTASASRWPWSPRRPRPRGRDRRARGPAG